MTMKFATIAIQDFASITLFDALFTVRVVKLWILRLGETNLDPTQAIRGQDAESEITQNTKNFFFFLSLPGWLTPLALLAATIVGLLLWFGLAPVSV